MKWLCQIRVKETDEMRSQTMILFRIIAIGVSYCRLKGDHIEISVGVGPLGCSAGISVWKHLLP